MTGGLKRSTALNNRERKRRKEGERKAASRAVHWKSIQTAKRQGSRFTHSSCLSCNHSFPAVTQAQESLRVMVKWLLQLSLIYLVWLEGLFNVWCYFFLIHGLQPWVSAEYKHTLGGDLSHFCVSVLQRNFVMLSQSEGLNHGHNSFLFGPEPSLKRTPLVCLPMVENPLVK